MTKDEALKLSMEAMEITGGFDVEINAIKEALAQPEHCSDCGQKLGDANHIHTCSPQLEQKSVAMADYMALTEKYVALKAAQPEPKPMHPQLKAMLEEYFDKCFAESTPHRKPLTDEEIAEFAERMEASDPTDSFWREFARAIEAAHGIKGDA